MLLGCIIANPKLGGPSDAASDKEGSLLLTLVEVRVPGSFKVRGGYGRKKREKEGERRRDNLLAIAVSLGFCVTRFNIVFCQVFAHHHNFGLRFML